MLFSVLIYIFVAAFIIQFFYYLFFSAFLLKKKTDKNIINNVSLPLSVVIHTKNNADLIRQNLDAFFIQTYNNFEIVVINDASIDETADLLEEFEKKYNNLKIVTVRNVEAFWANKKYALTLGIKATNNDYVVFSEINSVPKSKNWLTQIANSLKKETQIVIGHKRINYKKNSFSNLIFRFENLYNSLLNFSLTQITTPYTVEQSNYAIDKNLFFKVKGFISHIKHHNAHNDLFLKDASTLKNTTVVIHKNSFTTNKFNSSFNDWFSQKRLQYFTANHYKFKHKLYISLFIISKLLFYVLSVVNLFTNWKITLPFILFYYILLYFVSFKTCKTFKEKKLVIFTPILDFTLLSIQIIIFIVNSITKPSLWK